MCKCGEEYLTPLFYTLDDWGYTDSKVFARIKPGEGEHVPHRLVVCTKCHAVFAIPDDEFNNKCRHLRNKIVPEE